MMKCPRSRETMIPIGYALVLDIDGVSDDCVVCGELSEYIDVQEGGSVAYCDEHADSKESS